MSPSHTNSSDSPAAPRSADTLGLLDGADEDAPDGTFPPLVAPGPPLTSQDYLRYARHVSLPGIGGWGQRRLCAATVLVIGAGGLGSPALLYLAAAGVGTLRVVDDDVVDVSNVQRQIIHDTPAAEAGELKVESARRRIADLNPYVRVDARPVRVTADSLGALLDGVDLVLDGTDNFATRYLVADACEARGLPLVWGAMNRFTGQLAVWWSGCPDPDRAVGLRDLYPEPPAPGTVPDCATAGVMGSLPGTVGSMMATQAILLLTGVGTPLVGRLWTYDALTGSTRTLRLRPDPERERARCGDDGRILAPGAAAGAATCATIDGRTDTAREQQVGPPDAAPNNAAIAPSETQFISALELAAACASQRPPLVIDVREPWERRLSHLHDDVPIPLTELMEGDGPDRDETRPVVVYCASGGRSAVAVGELAARGVPSVRSLSGGILRWIAEGRPVETE